MRQVRGARSCRLIVALTTAGVLTLGLAFAGPSRGLAATGRGAAGTPPSAPLGARLRGAAMPAGVRQVCATPVTAGQMACMALLRTNVRGGATPDLASPDIYDPADLQSAYNMAAAAAAGGGGQTVAVVDAYNDPDAASDLSVYRKEWALPACHAATGAGCVTVVNQSGAARPLPGPDFTGGWELEESLDVDMVSAICPNCHILLVEANSDYTTDLGAAEDAAVRLGARSVSDSWGGGGEASDNAYFDHPGVAITVAAGDFGYGTSYPASAQFVTSVGGTTLTPAPGTARGWSETAWGGGANPFTGIGTGSGCAQDPNASPKPEWQTMDDTAPRGCLDRTDNDVAAVADPNTPVWAYDSYPYFGEVPGWQPLGGTSVASPLIASVYALAGTPTPGTYPASYLYQSGHAAGLYRVTGGSNGICEPDRQYLCNAADDYPGTSYNGPAGWGTPDGTAAFTDTATSNAVTVTNPGTQDDEAGTSLRVPTGAVDSAPGQQLAFSATGLPAGLSINPATGVISGRLPRAPGTSEVTVTAADSSGAAGSVSFAIVAVPDLRAAYHRVTGPVTLDIDHKCLDDTGDKAAAGTKVQIWTCSGDAAQRWSYLPDARPDSDGTLVIHGRCVTINSRSRLELRACTGAGNQQWSLQAGAGWLYNPASGLCMNDPGSSRRNGTQVAVYACVDSFSELFTLPPGPVLSGIGGTCLNDPRNSRASGIRVDLVACNGSDAQKWSVFSQGPTDQDHNGMCLSVYGHPSDAGVVYMLDGTPVRLVNCDSSAYFDGWFPLPDGQVTNFFGLCLDDASGSSANGTKLVIEDCYGTAGEIWAEG